MLYFAPGVSTLGVCFYQLNYLPCISMKAICLNLDTRPDRWQQAQKEFAYQGLHVERFAALPHPDKFFSFNQSQAAILATITEPTIVFEDDVKFVSGRLQELLATAPDGWDVLYLGGNVLSELQHVSGHWWRCVDTWTTHAVIYTAKAANYILQRFNPIEGIYDEFLRTQIQPELNCYICKPFICVQHKGYSDIWQTETEYGLLDTQLRLK